jgi:hypothetical protein
MTLSQCASNLTRQSPFGFTCSRCLTCCRFKKIQLNPYEAARMATRLGITTSDFIARYTTGGTTLRFDDKGTCVFLHANGCGVHPDRPLVCRLYPLGRYVDYLGVESFAQLTLEDGCQGRLHDHGTIDQYLEEQDAFPFMEAADRYLNLFWHLIEQLQDQEFVSSETIADQDEVQMISGTGGNDRHQTAWIDLDRTVREYCEHAGIPVPDDIGARMKLHIKAVRQWAAQPQGED